MKKLIRKERMAPRILFKPAVSKGSGDVPYEGLLLSFLNFVYSNRHMAVAKKMKQIDMVCSSSISANCCLLSL